MMICIHTAERFFRPGQHHPKVPAFQQCQMMHVSALIEGKEIWAASIKKILLYQSCGGCVSPGYQLSPSPHLFIQPLMQSAARIPQQTLKFDFPEMCSWHCAGRQILLNFVN